MKICILSTVNIKHMTLISHYTTILDQKKIEYDIIYVDKHNENESNNAKNIYKYKLLTKTNWSLLRKLFKYLGFRSFAKKIILEKNYDLIIVWNSFTAFLFSGVLINNHHKEYIVNIRDYALEKNIFIKYGFSRVIRNSLFTTISSPGFKSFLPRYDYIMLHSLNQGILDINTRKKRMRTKEEVLRISFIGKSRFYEMDKKFIKSLSNDERFLIQFFGDGSEILKEYADSIGCKNIKTVGRFLPEETNLFLEKTDIINNLYGYGRIELDTALSIRLYYSTYLYIPILVFPETYMDNISNEYNLGINVDKMFDKLGDEIFGKYHQISYGNLVNGANGFLNTINRENSEFNKVFKSHLNKMILKSQ